MRYFGRFVFDESSRTLWRARAQVSITRKAADLLAFFVQHPGTPLSRAEILAHVWPDTHVQLQNIKALVHELRGVLDDRGLPPRFIRADPGRGYTFVADVTQAPVPFSDEGPAPALIGRDDTLTLLRRTLSQAVVHAQPQVVLIEGERGWGKTALCRALARMAQSQFGVRVSLGQALELRGRVEPYAVLGDAVDLLARQYPAAVGAAIDAHAPTWSRRSHLPEAGPHAPRGNALSSAAQVGREITHVFEDLAQNVPLLLMFEDMQWSDVMTLEWLAAMAHRAAPSRLMVVATYSRGDQRAVGLLDRLAHDLDAEQWGHAVRLDPFSDEQVVEYAALRFSPDVARLVGPALAAATGGHPGLVAGALETLVGTGRLQQTPSGWQLLPGAESYEHLVLIAVASGLRAQIDHLTAVERRLLEAAAGVGVRFTSEAIASRVPGESPLDVQRRLADFADRRLLVCAASDDVSPSPRAYAFRHPVAAALLLATPSTWTRARMARVAGHDGLRRVTVGHGG